MGTRHERVRYCDFCFKSEHEVACLIANDSNIHICDKCVDICNEIIENYRMNLKAESSWEDDGGRPRD